MSGKLLVGTSSWTDKTLLDSGWYPKEAKSSEERLAFYASQFPLVEVDSTYYAPPAERNAILWVERTPKHFTFNIKAFALMTQHPTRVASLPKKLRDHAPAGKATVYQKDLPQKAIDAVFEMFASALMPLNSAGKLGAVLMQFPEWFMPNKENKDYILRCKELLPDFRLAIEFRQRTWVDTEAHQQMTFDFLSDNGFVYVSVDMPQGFSSSLPRVAVATTKQLAMVRFHGRNEDTWKKKGISAAERFNYLYSKPQLRAWQPKLFELAEQAREVHVLFNNCYQDKGVRNAAQMADLLSDVG
jgi:uncharacterized protein YecE (DUF72 family)